jgi:hypothetical protein
MRTPSCEEAWAGQIRTCGLGIKSPDRRHAADRDKLKDAANCTDDRCSDRQPTAPFGDKRLRAFLRAVLVESDNGADLLARADGSSQGGVAAGRGTSRRDRCDQALSTGCVWPSSRPDQARSAGATGMRLSPGCTRSFPSRFQADRRSVGWRSRSASAGGRGNGCGSRRVAAFSTVQARGRRCHWLGQKQALHGGEVVRFAEQEKAVARAQAERAGWLQRASFANDNGDPGGFTKW